MGRCPIAERAEQPITTSSDTISQQSYQISADNIHLPLQLCTIITSQPNISMQNQTNQTYSLRAILDSDIDPNLCKLMLHQIKSPLLEHSFQLTTDDERNTRSFTNLNPTTDTQRQNNNNPQGQFHDYRSKNGLDSYSVTNSYYETSRLQNKNQDNSKVTPIKDQPHQDFIMDDKYIESIVSPLQHYHLLEMEAKHKAKNKGIDNDFHILFGNFMGESGHDDAGAAGWCGQVFATELNPNQLVFESDERPARRRKIFKKSTKTCSPNKQSKLTFASAIQKLNKIQEIQLSNFIQFLSRILPVFTKMVPYRNNLKNNQALLHKMLLNYNPVDYETRQTISNNNRIINRMGRHKMSETFDALLKVPSHNRDYQYFRKAGTFQYGNEKKGEEMVEEDAAHLLQYLSKVQQMIEDYVSRQKSVEELQIVYGLLFQKNNSDTLRIDLSAAPVEQPKLSSPISNLKFTQQAEIFRNVEEQISSRNQINTSTSFYTPSLLLKLEKLLYSLHIDQAFFLHLEELSYIWPFINEQGYYDKHPSHFIKHLCKNDILEDAHYQPLKKKNKKYDDKLIKMGFTRNQ